MFPSPPPELELMEILGLVGAAVYAGNYLMVAFDRLTSASPVYYFCKLIAASLVLASLSHSFNLAAALIQVFFVIVSIIGLWRHRMSVARKPPDLIARKQEQEWFPSHWVSSSHS